MSEPKRSLPQPEPWMHEDPRPKDGAPDVIMIVLDDLGFAQLGAFGSDIATPNMDRLATGGLRYNRFHVTALCSPTRASLLTGRNHHAVGTGFLVDLPLRFQGYNCRPPKSSAPLPRVLGDAGYSTLAVGKWHLTPRWERTASGPFDRWPLGYGFQRFYGFLQGDANHWAPELVSDNHYVDMPGSPEDGYHLSEDLADTSIRMILDQKQATPNKPYFMYLPFGAMHSPHHVAPEWIEPYRGKFDGGWEQWREQTFARQVAAGVVPDGTELTARPPWVQEWESLDPEDRRMFARMQEVFAGFLTHTDAQIGRLLDFLESTGRLDNTLVLVMSDNGASAEGGQLGTVNEHRFSTRTGDSTSFNMESLDQWGGPETYPHYAWGWAWAGNTPLRLWKRYTWLGGTRAPLIVHWPDGIAASGEIRDQIAHAVDVMPTILDACGVEQPQAVDGVEQEHFDGRSLAATFDNPTAPSPRTTQYFEMLGSRSIIHDGWKATTDHVSRGVADEERLLLGSRDFDTDRWSLFRLSDDFAEANDLADQHPDIVAELERRWFIEAERNHVLPLNDSLQERMASLLIPPDALCQQATYRPGGSLVHAEAMPLLVTGFTLIADIDVPGTDATGILATFGDLTGGFALHVTGGKLTFTCARAGDFDRVVAPAALGTGRRCVGVRYTPGDPATLTLLDDGAGVASTDMGGSWPFVFQHGTAGLRLGHDVGLPVDKSYRPPHRWTGVLHDVTITATQIADPDPGSELHVALHSD